MLFYYWFGGLNRIVVDWIAWDEDVFLAKVLDRVENALDITPFVAAKVNDCCPFVKRADAEVFPCEANGGAVVCMIFSVWAEPLHFWMLCACFVVPAYIEYYQYIFPLLMQQTLYCLSCSSSNSVFPTKLVPPKISTYGLFSGIMSRANLRCYMISIKCY